MQLWNLKELATRLGLKRSVHALTKPKLQRSSRISHSRTGVCFASVQHARISSVDIVLGAVFHSLLIVVTTAAAFGLTVTKWSILKAQELHTRVHTIFTDEWQLEIKRREAEEKEEAYRTRVIGEEGYGRLKEFREWVSSHPHRHLILGILLDGLGR